MSENNKEPKAAQQDEREAFKAYNPLGYVQMDGLAVWQAACAWQRARQVQADAGAKPILIAIGELQSQLSAWKEYAVHQEHCATCGEAVSDCETGSALRDAAMSREQSKEDGK